jgi:hypothetical protein
MRSRGARWWRVAALALLAVVLTGCAVHTDVTISVDDDGSGVVRARVVLDTTAVQSTEAGAGTLEDRIRLSDLPDAGWEVRPWRRRPDGSAVLVVSKRFGRPDEVPGIVAELSGQGGPLRDVDVKRTRSLLSTAFAARGAVDMGSLDTGIQQDPDVVAALSAQRVDVGALDQQLLHQLADALSVRLTIDLPGEGPRTVDGSAGQRRDLTASSSVTDTTRIGLLALGALLVVVGAVVWLRRRRDFQASQARRLRL